MTQVSALYGCLSKDKQELWGTVHWTGDKGTTWISSSLQEFFFSQSGAKGVGARWR